MRFWKRYGLIIVLFVALRLMVLATSPADNLTWNFDALTVFSLLLALELLLGGRERWSAVAMGVGALIKLVPLRD